MQHGRLKVRTTAEQEEARRRERAEKVQIYRETTGRIFAKVSTQKWTEVGIEKLGDTAGMVPRRLCTLPTALFLEERFSRKRAHLTLYQLPSSPKW